MSKLWKPAPCAAEAELIYRFRKDPGKSVDNIAVEMLLSAHEFCKPQVNCQVEGLL